jgi:hypothetical protein
VPTYAISDICGYRLQLHSALATIDLDDPGTHLVFLGDYIDRGPDSLGVLELVQQTQREHPEQVVVLAGNHDRWFLDWLDGDDDDLIAGHVRTNLLHGDPHTHTVFADEGHLYIDGSVETTGRLNVLRIEDDGSWSESSVGLD